MVGAHKYTKNILRRSFNDKSKNFREIKIRYGAKKFSVYTISNYESIAKIVMKHFEKPLEEVTTSEL